MSASVSRLRTNIRDRLALARNAAQTLRDFRNLREFEVCRPSPTGCLFGGVAQRFLALVDHGAHLADAFVALSFALVMTENVRWSAGARIDGGPHFTLTNSVAVADVQGRGPETID
jgi:hypothetical protein